MSQNPSILEQMDIFLIIIHQAYNNFIIYKELSTIFRTMTIEKDICKAFFKGIKDCNLEKIVSPTA